MTVSAVPPPAGDAEDNDRVRFRHQAPLARGVHRVLVLLLATGGGSLGAPAAAPAQGTWTPTATVGAPAGRAFHTAVWTGSRMIAWGGHGGTSPSLGSGGVYDAAADGWTTTSTSGAPAGRDSHTAVWTGSRMIVWGGWSSNVALDTGGSYDPAADAWTATSTSGAPSPRVWHTAVWTGSRMIVWGGMNLATSTYMDTGGVYDPVTDTWTAVSLVGAPTARRFHTAVWTGSRMIVWGGSGDAGMVNTGGIYDPATNTWAPMSTAGAPVRRISHTAVWTGSRMVVWGGLEYFSTPIGTGGIYDPVTDTWAATAATGAPISRRDHAAVWTGSLMIVWGGAHDSMAPSYDSGGRYDPATDTWTATPTSGAPAARADFAAVWTGSRMVVWGGNSRSGLIYSTGGIYDDPTAPLPTDFHTVTPCRVFDTREASGPTLGAPLTCGIEQRFAVAGRCGVPTSATAVSLNVTGTGSTAQGNLRLFASGTAAPLASSVNYAAGQTRANNAVAPLGTAGQIAVLCSPSGTTHVVLDVNGYFQ